MRHKIYPILILLICFNFIASLQAQTVPNQQGLTGLKATAAKTIDAWHEAAADADFERYFSLMTQDGVFVGTDATEHWENEAFRRFSKPYFDRGKAWTFKSLERHIYQGGSNIWFDELLDTQMGICRGSGVLEYEEGQWKIAHYVLSIAVPNNQVDRLMSLKKAQDSISIMRLKGLDFSH